MTPVTSNTKTTLLLSGAFQPVGFISARAAMRNLMVGAVKAYDLYGNIRDWGSWIGSTQDLPEDYPSLRSVDYEFPIPTILVIPGYFGSNFNKRKRKKKNISIRQLYRIYDGICQYCHREVPYAQATRDHLFPRSKGGGNEDTNIILACKKCNLKKGSKFPFFDVHGNSPKPRVLSDVDFVKVTEKVKHRPEWEIFLK